MPAKDFRCITPKHDFTCNNNKYHLFPKFTQKPHLKHVTLRDNKAKATEKNKDHLWNIFQQIFNH